ncbi:hypothetical protein C4D60_Mb10t13990 [Musa balbisiana]|uniref:Non-haem dioxygenase N-terminal domain-containing protein n=1 Tax=Musa balbisiana TaxID=52838 RepID=A0A4S8IWY8_MUSBA|nr:hypothetical protein C4D60_Mb10t13990 [Musa balbisiana]
MTIPAIDFSKLDGKERAEALAQSVNGREEWGFFQLVNHGIPVELLERVKKVCSECYKLRAEGFERSKPVQMLNKLAEEEEEGDAKRLDDVDWEDVFVLQDDNQRPPNPPVFKSCPLCFCQWIDDMLPSITWRKTMRERREELRKLAEKAMEVMAENLGFFDKGNKPILFISVLLFRVRPNKPILCIRILKEIGWISERKRKPFFYSPPFFT